MSISKVSQKIVIPLLAGSAQELFDYVTAHLIKQGRPSSDDVGDCYYRNPEGLSCAAGCLIPDDQYNARIEGTTWNGLVMDNTVSGNHAQLIKSLQSAHDRWGLCYKGYDDGGLKYLNDILKEIARNYNLTFNGEVQ